MMEYTQIEKTVNHLETVFKNIQSNQTEISNKIIQLLMGVTDILHKKIESIEEYKLNGEYNRAFVIVKKIKETSIKYPRPQNKPKLNPIL